MLLRIGVYPYEYMVDWEKFNEKTLLEKEKFYGNLNMEDITDADYKNNLWRLWNKEFRSIIWFLS